MKDKISIADLKENAVKVFNTKKQVVNFVRNYDFNQTNSITITKINDNYIVEKIFEDEVEND